MKKKGEKGRAKRESVVEEKRARERMITRKRGKGQRERDMR